MNMPNCIHLLSWSRIFRLKNLHGSARTVRLPVGNSGCLRHLHTSRSSRGKVFLDKENTHSHEILGRSGRNNLCAEYKFNWASEEVPRETVLKLCGCPPREPDQLLKGFATIAGYCYKNGVHIADEVFDEFIDSFGCLCDQFSDEQLQTCLSMLQLLPEPPGINSRNFYEIWKPLDDVCLSRLVLWDTDKILHVSDSWYRVNLVKCSEFVWEGIKKIGRKTRKLSPSQLVHFTFLCNLVRKPLVEMIDTEMQFNRLFDALSLDEAGVICAGFFKTQSKLQNPELISKIYKRLGNNLQEVDSITLVNYIKVLRYSSKLPQSDLMTELLDKICAQVNRISTMACLHVALMGCDLQMCHQKCIELVLERFTRELGDARLKDMERIAHVMGLFNIETKSGVHKDLCQMILCKLERRIDEIIRYPKCFQACLHYLTLCGHYNQDMLNAALDQKFIKHVFGKNNLLGREVFCLDSFVRINLKDTYKGSLLFEKQRKTMGKIFTHYIPEKNSRFKLNVTDKILVEVNEICGQIWGISTIKHILPHFERPDIVLTFEELSGKSVPLSGLCPADYSGCILGVPEITGEGQCRAIAIIIGGWNNFVRNTNRPTGLLKMKLTQLELLGYSSILIPWFEWREQETTEDKRKYLRRRVDLLVGI